MEKILKNCIQCKVCGDVIESKSVHDFKTCSCGACSVDGGLEYLACLIDYLSADLREKPFRIPGKTQSDHLPTFMKTAKNREPPVKQLKKIQEG